jgi:hypothetical protein
MKLILVESVCSMSARYLKASIPRINSIVKQLCKLMERQVAVLPSGACFDVSVNLELCSMVWSWNTATHPSF